MIGKLLFLFFSFKSIPLYVELTGYIPVFRSPPGQHVCCSSLYSDMYVARGSNMTATTPIMMAEVLRSHWYCGDGVH